MIKEIIKDAGVRMGKSVESLRQSLVKVRTGRAHPSLLDHLVVDYYGSEVPISQVANVNVEDARTLMISPWEKQMVQPIEKAIMKSDLGLNPANDGNVIRVPIPPLNEERRKEYAKLLHKMAEEGKVSVRHARRIVRDELHQKVKDHEIGEDDGRRREDALEKLTHEYSDKIDELMKHKEEEVMAI